jgi:phage terminase large subunit-like protein
MPDWADRLKAGKSIVPPPIFPQQAEAALAIFKELKIVDAPGSPTFGESCAEWVFDVVRSIFGAYDQDSGRRLITEWFILVPKKNSKTTNGGGIMLTALLMNQRPKIPFALFGPTQEISDIAFQTVAGMIEADADLAKLFHVRDHLKTVENRLNGATRRDGVISFLSTAAAPNAGFPCRIPCGTSTTRRMSRAPSGWRLGACVF